MINVSSEFKTVMSERSDFKCNADILFADGTELHLLPKDFTTSNNSFTDSAGASAFPLGVAICRTIQIELLNDTEQYADYDFLGARIRLYLTLELSESAEKVEMGSFTVLEPETYGETVIITANDDMYRADKSYSTSLLYPASLSNIFVEACEACGIPFETASFTNSGYEVASPPTSEYTYRQIFGFIAMLAGGNARISRSGYMQILTYDLESPAQTLSDWITLKNDLSDITITGLETTSTTESETGESEETTYTFGDDGYRLTLENPFFAGQETNALTLIGARVVNLTFRKFEGDYIAYPLAEFMDAVTVTDRKGNSYTSVITDFAFTFFGKTTISNSAESVLRNSSQYVSDSTKAVIAARRLVTAEKTARETAIEQLQETLARSSGMFTTTEEQPDGSNIFYMHDRRNLADSDNIIMVTSEAIAFSTDGGATYPFGLQINGDVITRIIAAEGINADWIHSGTLKLGGVSNINGQMTVYSDSGALIASVDKNGTTYYNADGSYTVMSGSEFAGYDASGNRTFWVDWDEFHMQKGFAEQEFTVVDTIRLVKMENSNHVGVGFVAVADTGGQ